jgi:hypothetical protein
MPILDLSSLTISITFSKARLRFNSLLLKIGSLHCGQKQEVSPLGPFVLRKRELKRNLALEQVIEMVRELKAKMGM